MLIGKAHIFEAGCTCTIKTSKPGIKSLHFHVDFLQHSIIRYEYLENYYQPVKPDRYGFLIYNFDVSKAVIHNHEILFIGVPSRTGAQIVSIDPAGMKDYKNYLVRLVTPDHSEMDCALAAP